MKNIPDHQNSLVQFLGSLAKRMLSLLLVEATFLGVPFWWKIEVVCPCGSQSTHLALKLVVIVDRSKLLGCSLGCRKGTAAQRGSVQSAMLSIYLGTQPADSGKDGVGQCLVNKLAVTLLVMPEQIQQS